MTVPIDPLTASTFHSFGEGAFVEAGGQFHRQHDIDIGRDVVLRAHFWLNIIPGGSEPGPKIRFGDGCVCERGLIVSALNLVELEAGVRVGPHVFISDTDHEYREIGLPVAAQGLSRTDGRVLIGEDTEIGAGAVIAGNVRIGRGSVVLPGSVVAEDVPDRAIVSGSPARIVGMREDDAGAPPPARSGDAAAAHEEETKERETPPLLSICIPTYNRASNLDRCLGAILSQLQPGHAVEVVVSDNASTDETPEVIRRYAERYACVRGIRNPENIGADRNIAQVMRAGRGTFIKMQGDDDYMVPGALAPLLETVAGHPDCGIIHIFVHNDDRRIFRGEGMGAFLRASTIMSTFISGMIVRRQDLEQVEDPDKFIASSFNQMYVQYAILQRNPKFCVMHRSMFYYEANQPSGYNFGEVVFRSYQRILRYFIGRGLTEEDVRMDKSRALFQFILPWYRGIMYGRYATDTSGFEALFTEHYAEEPYYAQTLAEIRAIQTAVNGAG